MAESSRRAADCSIGLDRLVSGGMAQRQQGRSRSSGTGQAVLWLDAAGGDAICNGREMEGPIFTQIIRLSALMLVIGVVRQVVVAGIVALIHVFFAGSGLPDIIGAITGLALFVPGYAIGRSSRRATGRARYGFLLGLAVGALAGLVAGLASAMLVLAAPPIWLAVTYGGTLPQGVAAVPVWAFMVYFGPYVVIGAVSGYTGARFAPRQS